MFKKRLKNYISPIDQFLMKFNRTNALSFSQIAELKKYQKVNELRDDPKSGLRADASHESNPKSQLWEKF